MRLSQFTPDLVDAAAQVGFDAVSIRLGRGAQPTDPDWPMLGDTPWLEPYPEILLEGLTDAAAGPEARYEASEAISLAFITTMQKLPPRQRAVLTRGEFGGRAKTLLGKACAQ